MAPLVSGAALAASLVSRALSPRSLPKGATGRGVPAADVSASLVYGSAQQFRSRREESP